MLSIHINCAECLQVGGLTFRILCRIFHPILPNSYGVNIRHQLAILADATPRGSIMSLVVDIPND